MRLIAHVVLAGLLWSQATCVAAEEPPWPVVARVDRQPLRAQLQRLRAALANIGSPLPEQLARDLDKAGDIEDDAVFTRRVQDLLEAHCIAAVELARDRRPVVFVAKKPVELDEQGWRVALVKVINPDGLRARLRVDSPSAKPLPHALPEEVDARWLGLSMADGQPLTPSLTGLPLEYRIVELFARDAGPKTARLEFAAPLGRAAGRDEPAPLDRGSSVFAEWRFDRDAAGWQAANDMTFGNAAGSLEVHGNGDDPFMQVALPDPLPAGNFVLRIWGKSEETGVGQVLWWTEDRPAPDGDRVVGFPLEAGRATLYEIPFRESGRVTGIRIDPNGKPCRWRIDWIELANADGGQDWAGAEVRFDVRPSTLVTFRVLDDPDRPAMGCFDITDTAGRVYPPQNKRLAPDFFFQRQIYRADGESIRLPQGTYVVHCSRGPESIPDVQELVIGESPVDLTYRVKRWVDPSRRGYWSGDHHIHAAGCAHYENPTQGVHPPDMLRHCMGEDLKVGCCLTWGPCFDYQKRFFTGQLDSNSRYPYLIRYDVEVSGFGSHASGHLNLLRLREQIPPGGASKEHWPTLGLNTLRWAKRQGAVCGPAHSSIGLTRFVDRVPGTEDRDGPNGLPTFRIPAFDGIGANEFIMNVAHRVEGPDGTPVPAVDFLSTMNTDRTAELNIWYHVLNCGFQTRISGETDFPCITGERVGVGRVYARVDGELEYDRWCDAIAAGRSYVSDGRTHLMEFTARRADGQAVESGTQGSTLTLDGPQAVAFEVVAAMRSPTAPGRGTQEAPTEQRVELVVNGYPVAAETVLADGRERIVRFDHRIEKSSWVALRVFSSAHTNPVFVLVDGQPIRANHHSAQWCLRSVQQCWRSKELTYSPAERALAKQDYQQAEEVFRQILLEHGEPPP